MTIRASAILDRSAFPNPGPVAVYEMTEQEFLEWDQDGAGDWIDGRSTSARQQQKSVLILVAFFFNLLYNFGEVTGTGAVIAGPHASEPDPERPGARSSALAGSQLTGPACWRLEHDLS